MDFISGMIKGLIDIIMLPFTIFFGDGKDKK